LLRFCDFSSDTLIHNDLILLESMYGQSYVEFEIIFDFYLFPFFPPTIKPIWPFLENNLMSRIILLDELLLTNWNPCTNLNSIFDSINRLLSMYGHIDINNKLNSPNLNINLYSESQFQLCRLTMLTNIQPRLNQIYVDPHAQKITVKTKLTQQSWG
jgi:hypothetical protein